jgi:septal ring factor EnvC (AmiA/AmiB activator)
MLDFFFGRRTYSAYDYEALKALHKSSQEQIAHLLAQRDKLAAENETLHQQLHVTQLRELAFGKEIDDLNQELEETRRERDEIAADRQRQYVELTDEIARLKSPPRARTRKT